MIRKKNRYSRPKKAFEISRIKEENALLKKYGLKNKLEVWKSIAKVNYFRKRAKALAKSPLEEQKVLFDKLKALGLDINSIADVLALKIENLLERRLPTIIYKKGLAKTAKEARQMVAHKRILIEGKVINIPGYLVSLMEENLITLKKKAKPSKKEEPAQAESQAEQSENAKEAN
ncbi:MAG TPA: 30S ribosomal protein S4 [Candidatus Nanoarchaeia archaeon]|nr:30S ribosomal protein S4 [Candidatus Nanoarchaeia archaeon]